MAQKNWNTEWLNRNSQRAYPLAADATRQHSSGEFLFPMDLLVGLVLSVPIDSTMDPGKFYIKSLSSFAAGVNIVIGYDGGAIATTAVLRTAHTRNDAYYLGGLGDYTDITGQIVVGDFAGLDEQPAGQWDFTLAETRLEVHAIHPMIRGVQALRVRNGTDLSERITGDVVLQAGRNMRITPVLVAGQDPVLVFDAIEGEGLSGLCACENDKGRPIYTINGLGPDSNNNFALEGIGCVELGSISHGVKIGNSCAEPCCGFEEAEIVTDALAVLGRQAQTVETLLGTLEARVTQFESTVLGSKLGDRGCNPPE